MPEPNKRVVLGKDDAVRVVTEKIVYVVWDFLERLPVQVRLRAMQQGAKVLHRRAAALARATLRGEDA